MKTKMRIRTIVPILALVGLGLAGGLRTEGPRTSGLRDHRIVRWPTPSCNADAPMAGTLRSANAEQGVQRGCEPPAEWREEPKALLSWLLAISDADLSALASTGRLDEYLNACQEAFASDSRYQGSDETPQVLVPLIERIGRLQGGNG